MASLNLNKYKQVQHLLEDAEERAEIAENSLSKFRAKSRSSVNVRGLLGIGGGGLPPSASAGTVLLRSVGFFDFCSLIFELCSQTSASLMSARHFLANNLDVNQTIDDERGEMEGMELEMNNLMSQSINEEEDE